ncbi:MAG: DUF2098 domain-containing protein [Methanobrevibacter sp.]|jgi:hypothetical protein|nr:DUF2098 domain-containing protein [Candidatus Methanovirga aequatorialis]
MDIRKKPIKKDDFVRYTETGVSGKVLDIIPYSSLDGVNKDSKVVISNQDKFWIKIDKTGLWYLSDSLELLDERDIKKSRFEEGSDGKNVEEFTNDFEDMEIDSSAGIGGG